MIVNKYIKIVCFVILVVTKLNAQSQKEEGTGTPQQVNIITDYKPVITEAFKLSDNPSVRDTTPVKQLIKYKVLNKQYKTVIALDTIKPAKMKNETVDKLSMNYIRTGLGTYTTPYAELFFGSLRSKQWQYGAHAKHISSNYTSRKQGDATNSINAIDAYGKYIVNDESINLSTGWDRYANSIYSYNAVLFDSANFKSKYINKCFNINANAKSLNIDSSLFNHQVNLGYYNLNRNLSSLKLKNEKHFDMMIDVSKFNDNQLLGASIMYQHYTIGDSLSKLLGNSSKFNLLSFSPYVRAKGQKWRAILGATILNEFNAKKTRFFPNVWFDYNIVPDALTAYANINGNAKVNGIKSLTSDNPFITNFSSNYKTTTTTIDATVGLKGNFNSQFAYHFSANYAIIKQMQLFQEVIVFDTLPAINKNYHSFKPSDFLHTYQFNSIYEDVKYWNVNGIISYRFTKKVEAILNAKYQNFMMDTSKYAWYKEKLNISLTGKYQYDSKLSFNIKVYYVGMRNALSKQAAFSAFNPLISINDLGMQYRPYETRSVIYKLPAFADVNIGAEYLHTRKLSAFLNLNNLLNARTQLWKHTPTMGFWLMAGVTYSF